MLVFLSHLLLSYAVITALPFLKFAVASVSLQLGLLAKNDFGITVDSQYLDDEKC